MKDALPFIFGSEIRFASLLIGTVEASWGIVGFFPDRESWLSRGLVQSALGDQWFVVMFVIGVVLAAGAVLPWRSGRHIGLFLSSLAWFTMFGVFLAEGALTEITITMPIFGVYGVVLMYADARRKPREKLASG